MKAAGDSIDDDLKGLSINGFHNRQEYACYRD